HGKAAHHTADANDDERPLTDAGRAALKSAGPLLRRLNLRPDLVLSSPLPRAIQTAELVLDGLEILSEPVADDRLRPGAGWGDLARAMAAHPDARRIM